MSNQMIEVLFKPSETMFLIFKLIIYRERLNTEFETLQFVEIYNPVGGLTKNSYASLDSYLLRAVTVLGLKLIALVLCSQSKEHFFPHMFNGRY